jgi:hypothetical protein
MKIMKSFQRLINKILIVTAILFISSSLDAQDKNSKQSQTSTKKTIIFETPGGFMPAELPPDKKGLMMLNPKKPAGIFVAYTPDHQKSEDFIELRKTLTGFFVEDKNAKFEWKEIVLPAYDGVEKETGKLLTTIIKGNEVQVVVYTRTVSEGQDVVYGYFAMKNPKGKKNSADFVDASGGGVKEFEAFWKTIAVEK